MKNRRKISLIKIVIIIVIVFNILWLLNYTVKYGGYAKTVEYNTEGRIYQETDKETNTVFYVMMPSYPTFTSNLYIDCYCNDYDDECYSLYINPKLISGYEIGFMYTDANGDLVAEIWFDDDMQILEKYESTGTIEEYKEPIKKLCDIAYEKWGILIYDKE